MIVLFILVDTTIPFKIFPLIETLEVKGHFLSMYYPSMASLGVLNPNPIFLKYLTPLFVFLANNFIFFFENYKMLFYL